MSQSFGEDEVCEAIVGTYQEDAPLSLKQHLDALKQADFVTTDVLYKKGIFAVYLGIKS